MRAKTINFERGKDPKDAMKVGIGSKKYIPEMLKTLENIGFRIRSNEIDEWHIRWDVHSPWKGVGGYHEIAWLEEGSLKDPNQGGYYLGGEGEKQTGFSTTPWEAINRIIENEEKGLDDEIMKKKAEADMLNSEVRTMEEFRSKVNSFKTK